LGGSIEIAALERASLKFSSAAEDKVRQIPKKPKTVAVIGGGLRGTTAAFDLARKGWGVELFEREGKLGGKLRALCSEEVPEDAWEIEFAKLSQLGVKVHFNSSVGRDAVELVDLYDKFDALYVATMDPIDTDFTLEFNAAGGFRVDPATFQTSEERVFAAYPTPPTFAQYPSVDLKDSPVQAMSDGRRTANSIDRYLQRVSLTAARTNEGAFESKLFTNTSKIEPLAATAFDDSQGDYSREGAMTEAQRCIQCECLECVKACDYLAHYKSYPKRYIREVYNNLSIVMGTRHSNQFINTCAVCGLCAEVCPTDVDMGAVCKNARESMVINGHMPPSAHDFALRDLAFSNGDQFAVSMQAPDRPQTQYVFFPGCQLSGSSPEYVDEAFGFLQGALGKDGVGLMLRCCGVPADWAGREDLVGQADAEFISELAKLGNPTLIIACSSCFQYFSEHFPELKLLSLWEVYDEFGSDMLPKYDVTELISVHDPCSTRYESGIQESVRSLLIKMGCTLEELEYSRERSKCCSYGGVMWLANRPVAEKMAQTRIAESPQDYITYCAMCQDFFVRRGKETRHLLDYIYGSPGAEVPKMPAVGYSQRHENRRRLKMNLLKKYWNENMIDEPDYLKIQLILPGTIQQQIEDRLILIEDIQKVINYAEQTGKRMQNKSNGHLLAYFKPHAVTYWVEYTPEGEAFRVHKAYSHRMEIASTEAK